MTGRHVLLFSHLGAELDLTPAVAIGHVTWRFIRNPKVDGFPFSGGPGWGST